MENSQTIDRVIYEAIEEINRTLEPQQALDKVPETVLFGESSRLDSLAFVNFAVTVEEKLGRIFKQSLSLFDLISAEERSRWTVADLSERIAEALKRRGAVM
jgi:acyl carrier protein